MPFEKYFLKVKEKTISNEIVFSKRYCKLLVLGLDNFLAAVVTARLANAVAENDLSALGALGHAGESELPVIGASFVSASFRYFLLWYCHYLHLLEALNTICLY